LAAYSPAQEILGLSAVEFGGVDLEQRIALVDQLARRVDVQFRDQPLNFVVTSASEVSS